MSTAFFYNWTLKEWNKISLDKAAKAFSWLMTNQCEIANLPSPVDRLHYVRCWWLAITHTDRRALNENGIPFSDNDFKDCRNQKTLDWLKICVSTESTDVESKDANFYFALRGVDREEDVRRIIWGPSTKESGKRKEIDPFFKGDTTEDKEGERRGFIYLEFLATWFLKRYDLPTAGKIIYRICCCSHKNPYNKPFPIISFILLSVIVVFFVLRLIWNVDPLIFGFNWKTFIQTPKQVSFLPLDGRWNLLRIFEGVLLFVTCTILVFGGLDFKNSTNLSLWSKLLIPRMLCGIVLGYMSLLISEDTWNFALNVDRLEGTVIAASALFFSFYYLITEIKNVVQDARTATYRGLRIWLIGLFESFVLGIVTQDLLARPFIGYQKGKSIEFGLLGGYIYPKILLLYFPLALLIGIFVQIIWEDKPITHPL